MYVSTSSGGLFDFPWDPSARQAVSNANVPYLFYYNNITKDFPGTPADDFALIAAGNINIAAGQHFFCIYSAGGSWLYVDDRLFINNFYYYNYYYYNYYPTSGNCQYFWLEAGIHTITVKYFKHTGAAALELYMDGSLITPLKGKLIGLFECFSLEERRLAFLVSNSNKIAKNEVGDTSLIKHTQSSIFI